jgi:hypothetical protein
MLCNFEDVALHYHHIVSTSASSYVFCRDGQTAIIEAVLMELSGHDSTLLRLLLLYHADVNAADK